MAVSIGTRFPGREVVRVSSDLGYYEHCMPLLSGDALLLQNALLTRPAASWLERLRAWIWRD